MPVRCGTKMKKLFAHDGKIVSHTSSNRGGRGSA
jgi:hypothetical protein